MTLALLLTAVTGAWAQSPTIYFQQDYATETVDWSTSTAGRYTPIVEDGYLTVTQNQRANNGVTLTCTATQGKVDAGKDFTMTFNVKLGASTQQTATAFNIYDAANSAPILSFAEGSAGATAWKINGGTQTATVSAGGGKSLNELSWIFVQVTSIAGGKTYLTLKDEQNNIIDRFDKTEIPTISVAGGLGKMTFVTSRYSANFAIDNVLVRDVEDDAASTGPEVAWNASTKTGTFEMPGSDVVLTPQYAPAAKWDVVENVEQLPTAIEGVIAGQDAAIVTAGQSAQGTVMYFATTDAEMTAEKAAKANGWLATVPTAKNVADDGADVYVWYYIKGADTPDGQQATEENTFNDTEPACLTVQVLTNKFDIQFNAANANTIEAGKATVTVGGTDKTSAVTEGKLQGVKMGSEVKVKANTGYKFRKVEVKKAAPALKTLIITGVATKSINYVEGDTWQQAIERPENAGSGLKVQGNYILNGGLTLMIGSGYVRPGDTIDATKNYSLEAD